MLPKLGAGPLSGYPRVYALALTLVAHTDSELDEPRITRFVQAFQKVVPLTIDELWALPTMFRLVLLENLKRLSEQILSDHDPAMVPANHRLEIDPAGQGQDSDEVRDRKHLCQAANQLTVGNCVLSLRLLSAVDWNSFFEQNSLVERILSEDPAGAYPLQDFSTSDRYRKGVEKIARGANADELEVAAKAIEMAWRA